MYKRRDFIIGSLSGAAMVSIGLANRKYGINGMGSNRKTQEEILDRIKAPVFPDKEFMITEWGAIGDGVTDCLPAITTAIRQCNQSGGGKVVIPEGVWWLNGPVHLKSNVNLYLADGAVIRFSQDPNHYLPLVLTRWEGTELFNYSPLIYTYQATNVAITGKGTIDGNSKEGFGSWKPKQKPGQDLLRKMGAEGVAVHERIFGEGHWIRPSMIQFFGCNNVLVEGITIIDAPFWVIHPVYCENVIVRGIRVNSHNPNNDGVDPDSSVDVLIEDCVFDTGDDSIAIKSGRDQDGWRVGQATENVIVRNCEMNSKHNGLCIGSEMSGSVRNVFMEECRVGKVESAIYFKANLDRGGTVEKVFVRNITVSEVKSLINFTTAYHSYRGGNYPPTFRDFLIQDILCEKAGIAIDAVGVPDYPLQNITLENCTVNNAEVVSHINHVKDFELKNVKVNGSLVSI